MFVCGAWLDKRIDGCSTNADGCAERTLAGVPASKIARYPAITVPVVPPISPSPYVTGTASSGYIAKTREDFISECCRQQALDLLAAVGCATA